MKHFLCCAAAILIMSAPANAVTNLLTNPGFEDAGGSYNGWTTFGNGPNISTSANDSIFLSGAAASKVFGEGSPGFSAGGYFQAFTPTAGKLYEFSGYYYVSSADPMPGTATCPSNRAVAQITFYDDNNFGVQIARNEVLVGDWSTPQDQWIPFSVSMQAPPAATRVQCFILFLQPATDPGAVFIDDLVFCELTPQFPLPNLLANPSFSSGLTGWETFGNVFADQRNFARYSPPGGAKMFGPFGVNPPGGTSGMVQQFDTEPNAEWVFSTYVMTTCEEDPIEGTNPNFCTMKIVFKNAVGAEIAFVESTIVDATSPLGTWSHFEMSATAPAPADSVCAYLLFVQPPANAGGAAFFDDVCFRPVLLTGLPDDVSDPRFTLHQNAPNPFNPTTRISFDLEDPDVVEMTVYDASGRRVTTLIQGTMSAGPHNVTWDGRDAAGSSVASGVYWYVLKTSRAQTSKKMVLLK
jgi:hypothetical protein